MPKTQYLVENGGERKYVEAAELAALLKDGWRVIGRLNEPEVPVPPQKPSSKKPQAENPKPAKPEDKAEG